MSECEIQGSIRIADTMKCLECFHLMHSTSRAVVSGDKERVIVAEFKGYDLTSMKSTDPEATYIRQMDVSA